MSAPARAREGRLPSKAEPKSATARRQRGRRSNNPSSRPSAGPAQPESTCVLRHVRLRPDKRICQHLVLKLEDIQHPNHLHRAHSLLEELTHRRLDACASKDVAADRIVAENRALDSRTFAWLRPVS